DARDAVRLRLVELLLDVVDAVHGLAVDAHDHVSALQPGILGVAARLALRPHHALEAARQLQLAGQVRGQVLQRHALVAAALALRATGRPADSLLGERAEGHPDLLLGAVAQDPEMDGAVGRPGRDVAREVRVVAHLAAVHADHDVVRLQAGLVGGDAVGDVGDDRAL